MGVTSNILKFVGLTPVGPNCSWHIPVNTIKMIIADEENLKVYVYIDGEGRDLVNHDYIEITAPAEYLTKIADALSMIITNFHTLQNSPVIVSNTNVQSGHPFAYITNLDYIPTAGNPEIELCCPTDPVHSAPGAGDNYVSDFQIASTVTCSQDINGCSIVPQNVVEALVSNGIAPYFYATEVFSSEQAAQNNITWLPSTQSTSHFYSGMTSDHWIAVKDSYGTHQVLEVTALSCGCPTVSVNHVIYGPMVVEARIQDHNPFIYPQPNGKAVVDTILNCVGAPSYLWSVGASGYDVVEANCSVERCVNNLPVGPVMVRITDSSPVPQVVYMRGFVLSNAPMDSQGGYDINGICSNTGNSYSMNGVGCCGSDMYVSDETTWNAHVNSADPC